jgi:glycosyltransferase involved in cell wall biosynthesis
MWPVNLPARRLLRLPDVTWVTWALFDSDWYRASYPSDTENLASEPPATVLRFYLDQGQRRGHSPNPWFHEAWHRRTYPQIADLVKKGRFESAFDAYCRGGCLDRSPHWLFDEQNYRRWYPDVTESTLRERGLANGYDHYLWRGHAEGRSGHLFLDPALVRGSFRQILHRVTTGGPEPRLSVHFDPVWYLVRYPAVAQAIAAGTWRSALEHYLSNDTPTQFDPNHGFSEVDYLALHADVQAMVDSGGTRNGYTHFLRYGLAQRRPPRNGFNLGWYAELDSVRTDIERGLVRDAFTHWLTIGLAHNLPTAPPAQRPTMDKQAGRLHHGRATILAAQSGRIPLRFEVTGTAALSVLMVLHNGFDLTLMTLGSLRSNFPGEIELVLIDSGSTDSTRTIERFVQGATVLHFESDIGSVMAHYAAMVCVTADAVLLLANGVELAPGAVAAGLRRLQTDPRTGLVGGMVVRPDGRLAEAGGIVWSDGTAEGYQAGGSPLTPEAQFARDVDYCSSVFLMGRRTLLTDLAEQEVAITSAAHRDADLGLKTAQAGYRVVYDPALMVFYTDDDAVLADPEAIERTRALFLNRHAATLRQRPSRDDSSPFAARFSATGQKHVLFIEDTVPLRSIGSGFVRSNDLVRAMAELDYRVTMFPIAGARFDLASIISDMPDTVEVMREYSQAELEAFLMERRGRYHAIWIARTHNLDAIRPILERCLEGIDPRPQIILDTEAITSVREAEFARLEQREFDLDAAVRYELRNSAFCDRIVSVSGIEASLLREHGLHDIAVIGHQQPLRPTLRPFARRAGMLFVGAIHRMDSPNYDSLCWFVDEVLPLVEAELGWKTRLTVAGYVRPEVDLHRFTDHQRVTLIGEVPDLEPLYDSHLLMVAPTRFAAGIPYKVHEAASYGLPVVATELLRSQLDWQSGTELLSADVGDAETFAHHVIELHRNESLWQNLRDSSLRRLRLENNWEDCKATVAELLG